MLYRGVEINKMKLGKMHCSKTVKESYGYLLNGISVKEPKKQLNNQIPTIFK